MKTLTIDQEKGFDKAIAFTTDAGSAEEQHLQVRAPGLSPDPVFEPPWALPVLHQVVFHAYAIGVRASLKSGHWVRASLICGGRIGIE